MEKALLVQCAKWLPPFVLMAYGCGKSAVHPLAFGNTKYALTAYPGRTNTFVELVNKGDKPLLDVDVSTSCGCMRIASGYSNISLIPGQVVRIPVEISLEKDSDTKQFVIAKSPGIFITATVDVRVKWPVGIENSQLDLGVMDSTGAEGGQRNFTLKIDKGVKKVSLRSLSPIVELITSQHGDQLRVSARLGESAPLGDSNVPVELSYETSAQSANAILPLKVKVKADQFFEPSAVSFGVVKLRERVVRSAVFKSRTSVAGATVESGNPSVLVDLVNDQASGQTLKLSWIPTRTGTLKSHVNLRLGNGTIKRLAVSGFAVE